MLTIFEKWFYFSTHIFIFWKKVFPNKSVQTVPNTENSSQPFSGLPVLILLNVISRSVLNYYFRIWKNWFSIQSDPNICMNCFQSYFRGMSLKVSEKKAQTKPITLNSVLNSYFRSFKETILTQISSSQPRSRSNF